MIKTCVITPDGGLHIGEWDYQYVEVVVRPEIIDEETNEIIVQAVTELVARNPLPEGAIIETRDFEYDDEKGWYEVGKVHEPTLQERLEIAEQALLALMEVQG